MPPNSPLNVDIDWEICRSIQEFLYVIISTLTRPRNGLAIYLKTDEGTLLGRKQVEVAFIFVHPILLKCNAEQPSINGSYIFGG